MAEAKANPFQPPNPEEPLATPEMRENPVASSSRPFTEDAQWLKEYEEFSAFRKMKQAEFEKSLKEAKQKLENPCLPASPVLGAQRFEELPDTLHTPEVTPLSSFPLGPPPPVPTYSRPPMMSSGVKLDKVEVLTGHDNYE